MKFASLNDLYLQQLKDLHSAESQLIKALPKMAKAARNPDLKNAFIEHLDQAKGHLECLKQAAEKLGKRLAGHTCAANEGSHLLETFFEPGRPVFQGPIKQGVFKTDVVASFLALDPFVTKDLL